jgi:Zn-finger nucleic acid-binding protein
MNCPECDVQLKKISIGDDQIKECPTCLGIWFDKGQLDSVKDEVLPETGWVDVKGLKEQFDFKASTDVLSCPQCQDEALFKIQDPNKNTEFSICRRCKGTWMATGQFLSFINLLLDEIDDKSGSELASISLQQAKKLLTQSKSPIAEWQNFKAVLSLLKVRVFVENPKLKNIIVGLEKSLPL